MTAIGFLHAAEIHVATFDRLVSARAPEATCHHRVDPALLARAVAGGANDAVREGVRAHLAALRALGAGAIVCTCSTLGPVAEAMGAGGAIPVLRVDRPMMDAAVGAGARIGVVTALASTREPTFALLSEVAEARGASIVTVDLACEDAWARFEAGDLAGYVARVAERARAAAGSVDAIVLAQASMAPAVDLLSDLAIPVLASPPSAVAAALAVARGR